MTDAQAQATLYALLAFGLLMAIIVSVDLRQFDRDPGRDIKGPTLSLMALVVGGGLIAGLVMVLSNPALILILRR